MVREEVEEGCTVPLTALPAERRAADMVTLSRSRVVGWVLVAAGGLLLGACDKDKKESKADTSSAGTPPADYGKCDSFIPGDPVDLSDEKLVLELVKKDGRGGAVATIEQLVKRCAKARVPGPTPGSSTEVVILDVEVKGGDGKVLLPFRFKDYAYIPSATQTVKFSAPASDVGADKALEVEVRASRVDS